MLKSHFLGPGEQNQGFVQRSFLPLTPDVKEEADDDADGIESAVIHGVLHQGNSTNFFINGISCHADVFLNLDQALLSFFPTMIKHCC